MSPPARPPSRIATNAATRAPGEGARRAGHPCRPRPHRRVVRRTTASPRRLVDRACHRGRPDLQRGRQHRAAAAARSASAAPEAEMLDRRRRQPGRHRRPRREVGRELGQIDVVRRPGKNGLGAAYRVGLRAAIDRGAEICVQMDADLSHDPAVLPALIANVEHGADLAIGSRYVPGGLTENWPRRRRWLSRWGNRYAAGRARSGDQRRHRGVSRLPLDALERMEFETVAAEGYGFQVEMTYRLVRHRRQGRRVPDHVPGSHRRRVEDVRQASSARPSLLVVKLWVGDFGGRRRRRARRLRAARATVRTSVPVTHGFMRNWVVGGALIPRVHGDDLDGLVLVGNRRRDRTLEWTPPGGVIDHGESMREGLAREVLEETGLVGRRLGGSAATPSSSMRRTGLAAARRGLGDADVVGDIVIADPDGIVEEVRQVASADGEDVAGSQPASGCTCRSATGSTVRSTPQVRSASASSAPIVHIAGRAPRMSVGAASCTSTWTRSTSASSCVDGRTSSASRSSSVAPAREA